MSTNYHKARRNAMRMLRPHTSHITVAPALVRALARATWHDLLDITDVMWRARKCRPGCTVPHPGQEVLTLALLSNARIWKCDELQRMSAALMYIRPARTAPHTPRVPPASPTSSTSSPDDQIIDEQSQSGEWDESEPHIAYELYANEIANRELMHRVDMQREHEIARQDFAAASHELESANHELRLANRDLEVIENANRELDRIESANLELDAIELQLSRIESAHVAENYDSDDVAEVDAPQWHNPVSARSGAGVFSVGTASLRVAAPEFRTVMWWRMHLPQRLGTQCTTCAICLGNIVTHDMRYMLSCGHEFHVVDNDTDCAGGGLPRWLAQRAQCPLCRGAVRT